jgi:hypothetical protein
VRMFTTSLAVLLDRALEVVPAPGERFFNADISLRDTQALQGESALLRLRLALAPRATDWPTTWARARLDAICRELDARAARLRRRSR